MRKENNEFTIIKENKDIAKVTLFVVLGFIVATLIVSLSATYYFTKTEMFRIEGENNAEILNIKLNIRLDKFTYCLQSMMIESKNAGKPIDAQKAKEICKELQ